MDKYIIIHKDLIDIVLTEQEKEYLNRIIDKLIMYKESVRVMKFEHDIDEFVNFVDKVLDTLELVSIV